MRAFYFTMTCSNLIPSERSILENKLVLEAASARARSDGLEHQKMATRVLMSKMDIAPPHGNRERKNEAVGVQRAPICQVRGRPSKLVESKDTVFFLCAILP